MDEHQGPSAGDVVGGRYRLTALIGRGGTADVYRAEDLRLGRDVAVKVFRPGVAAVLDRTTREARLLAGLAAPTIVAVLDGAPEDGGSSGHLVMELVDGSDLGTALAAGPLPAEQVRRAAADVAGALALLHSRKLVHRDVKPANILLQSEAAAAATGVTAKLSDFGIALALDGTRITASETIIGTAAYLSPEQVQGRQVGPASDVYALGLVVIEALTGTRAFPGGLAESAVARLNRPPALPPLASPELAGLLARMTTLDPDARPTAAEAAAEFDALEGRMTGEEPPETQPMLAELFAAPAPVQQRARGPVAAALGVAAALVVGIGLLLSPAGLPAADVRAAAEPVTPVAAPTPTPTASRSAAPHSASGSSAVVRAAVATRSSAAPSATPKPAAPRSGKAGHHGTLHHSHHVATKHAEPKPKAAPKPKQHGPGKASHGGKGHGRA